LAWFEASKSRAYDAGMIAASTSLVAIARTMASSVCIGFTVTRVMSTFFTRAICSS